MSLAAPRTGGADLLTRTTLQIEGRTSSSSIAEFIKALHRVPGVLLAEVNAASTIAIVAHDEAVPTAALLAAATGAGVPARALVDVQTPTVTVDAAPLLQRIRMRKLLALAGGVYFAVALIAIFRANDPGKPWLFPILMLPIWAFFVAQGVTRRR